LDRARQLLRLLESEQLARAVDPRGGAGGAGGATKAPAPQLGLFAATPDPVLERLAQTDVNALTPVQALALLDELVQAAKNGRL
jgi:hypothetical protein